MVWLLSLPFHLLLYARLLEGFTSQFLSFNAVDFSLAVKCIVINSGVILVPSLILPIVRLYNSF